jgi:hypothetical protein
MHAETYMQYGIEDGREEDFDSEFQTVMTGRGMQRGYAPVRQQPVRMQQSAPRLLEYHGGQMQQQSQQQSQQQYRTMQGSQQQYQAQAQAEFPQQRYATQASAQQFQSQAQAQAQAHARQSQQQFQQQYAGPNAAYQRR